MKFEILKSWKNFIFNSAKTTSAWPRRGNFRIISNIKEADDISKKLKNAEKFAL